MAAYLNRHPSGSRSLQYSSSSMTTWNFQTVLVSAPACCQSFESVSWLWRNISLKPEGTASQVPAGRLPKWMPRMMAPRSGAANWIMRLATLSWAPQVNNAWNNQSWWPSPFAQYFRSPVYPRRSPGRWMWKTISLCLGTVRILDRCTRASGPSQPSSLLVFHPVLRPAGLVQGHIPSPRTHPRLWPTLI